ncbi:unnamed protein product [Phaeothamnion confervicola]
MRKPLRAAELLCGRESSCGKGGAAFRNMGASSDNGGAALQEAELLFEELELLEDLNCYRGKGKAGCFTISWSCFWERWICLSKQLELVWGRRICYSGDRSAFRRLELLFGRRSCLSG